MMRAAKRVSVLLDVALLAASFAGGPPAEQVRVIAAIVIAALGMAAIFCGIVLFVAVLQQRQPPYPL